MEEKIEALAQLFRETAIAHHEAYSATNGDDPAWPLWYADYLYDKLPPYINEPISKDAFISALIRLDQEVRSKSEDVDWAMYYAKSLVNRPA